jgi:hypothetical protein
MSLLFITFISQLKVFKFKTNEITIIMWKANDVKVNLMLIKKFVQFEKDIE